MLILPLPMLKNRLINSVVFSFGLHIGLFLLVYPVFYSESGKNFLYSWPQGRSFMDLDVQGKANSPLADRIDYRDFLLPVFKQFSGDFKKFSKKQAFPKVTPSFKFKELSKKSNRGYYLPAESQGLLFEAGALTEYQLASFRKLSPKTKVQVNVLVSPAGRVIWAQAPAFSLDVSLKFDLDDWVRSLFFQADGSYYWKTIEIVLE